MKFYINGFIVIIAILMIGCSKKKFSDFPNHTIHYIEFSNSKVALPSNFIRLSIEELQYSIDKSEMERVEKKRIIAAYKQFKSLNQRPIFFVDSLDIFNSITFFNGEYIDFTQADLIPYVQMLRDIQENSEFDREKEIEAIDYKFIQQTLGKVMKAQFRVIQDKDTLYRTQHIINRGYQTFSAIVQNRTGMDYYKEITAIKFNY